MPFANPEVLTRSISYHLIASDAAVGGGPEYTELSLWLAVTTERKPVGPAPFVLSIPLCTMDSRAG